jgi:GNAT superfamily N-acetyltransferase
MVRQHRRAVRGRPVVLGMMWRTSPALAVVAYGLDEPGDVTDEERRERRDDCQVHTFNLRRAVTGRQWPTRRIARAWVVTGYSPILRAGLPSAATVGQNRYRLGPGGRSEVVCQVLARVRRPCPGSQRSGPVARTVVGVRVARSTDADDLVEVWAEATGQEVVEPDEEVDAVGSVSGACAEAAAAIARIDDAPDELLLVAESDGKVIGAVHLRRAPISPIQIAQAVHVSHLHVRPGHRRRGVASALLAAATAWAEETKSPHLLATTPASSRDAHRFLARLGFGQVAILRGVSVSALRCRLSGTASVPLVVGPADGLRGGGTGRLIAARRRLRRRAPARP